MEDVMVLSVGLAVMCATLGVCVVAVILPQLGSRGPLHFFLRLATVAGVLSVGSTAMFILAFQGGGPLPLALGAVGMVLAPVLLCIAVTPPRSKRIKLLIALAIILSAAVGSSVAFLSDPTALRVRLCAVALACLLCAVLSARARTLPRRSAGVMSATNGAYGLYSLARLAVGASPAAGSAIDEMLFSAEAAAAAATVCVLLVGLAVVLVRRSPVAHDRDASREWSRVALADWRRGTLELGADGVLALLTELRLAAREVDPTAVDVYHGVEVRRPATLLAVRARLRDAYGWRPAQLALLSTPGNPGRPRRSPAVRGVPRPGGS
ncbi:hypothetical protein [uncultured Microbacterium sp.]|uniref:hypothetical protein n=1 Tax=uncultured Microbacterium sp. TaxID=191216 RepID=UPI0025D945D8|nr:hypothetical protein [uncultured Microbacterium sp.]